MTCFPILTDPAHWGDGAWTVASTESSRLLRTLDAIHLATALTVGDDLDTIVTYDDRMIEGAGLLGLTAVAPR